MILNDSIVGEPLYSWFYDSIVMLLLMLVNIDNMLHVDTEVRLASGKLTW